MVLRANRAMQIQEQANALAQKKASQDGSR